MWAIFRVLLSSAFLLSVVLSIPLAFDVGGRDSGLAFSLALFAFYTTYSAVTALTPPDSRRFRWLLSTLLRWLQWLVIPTLLIWALGRYAVDAGSSDWVARTMGSVFPSARDAAKMSWYEWLFGNGGVADTLALGGWDKMLRYSSPVFQLLEGFCSLLVIQAAGRITRWLVNKGRSDLWVVSLFGPGTVLLRPACADFRV